ncbi:MAG: hypothetical protein K8R53_12315, partial [Bacteroidales bacterium]|nr:hypothetical protein [Bacteroidales bacterium]
MLRELKIPSILILLVFCYYFASGQNQEEIRFDHLFSENTKIEKGLSQNWIYCILQDSQGYIWFGTWEGLNKFDGYNFTIFNVSDGLTDHTIYSIIEDENKVLWNGTAKGFNRFDRITNELISYFHDSENKKSLINNKV